MKKLSYLLVSSVSALAAMLPMSATAKPTDATIREALAATEPARPADTIPADTIKVSKAARQQLAAKARGCSTVQASQAGRHFLEEIPQAGRRFVASHFGEEIPQVRRRPAPHFSEEIPALFPTLSFGEEIPQVRRRRLPPMFGEEIPSIRRR